MQVPKNKLKMKLLQQSWAKAVKKTPVTTEQLKQQEIKKAIKEKMKGLRNDHSTEKLEEFVSFVETNESRDQMWRTFFSLSKNLPPKANARFLEMWALLQRCEHGQRYYDNAKALYNMGNGQTKVKIGTQRIIKVNKVARVSNHVQDRKKQLQQAHDKKMRKQRKKQHQRNQRYLERQNSDCPTMLELKRGNLPGLRDMDCRYERLNHLVTKHKFECDSSRGDGCAKK